MNTPNGAEVERRSRRTAGDAPARLWWCVECLLGGVVASAAFLLALPTLMGLLRPLGLLSTSALAFAFLFAWLFLWATFEVARERMATA